MLRKEIIICLIFSYLRFFPAFFASVGSDRLFDFCLVFA